MESEYETKIETSNNLNSGKVLPKTKAICKNWIGSRTRSNVKAKTKRASNTDPDYDSSLEEEKVP